MSQTEINLTHESSDGDLGFDWSLVCTNKMKQTNDLHFIIRLGMATSLSLHSAYGGVYDGSIIEYDVCILFPVTALEAKSKKQDNTCAACSFGARVWA